MSAGSMPAWAVDFGVAMGRALSSGMAGWKACLRREGVQEWSRHCNSVLERALGTPAPAVPNPRGIRWPRSDTPPSRSRPFAIAKLEATGRENWSDSLEAVWETDAEIVAAVLPPPLEPGPEPLVRLNISTVTMPGGHVFGAGWFGVQARYGTTVGEYPLLMPMSTEQATVGGRETFGEPKKIARITSDRDGDRIHNTVERMGYTVAEIKGTITGEREPREGRADRLLLQAPPLPRGTRHARRRPVPGRVPEEDQGAQGRAGRR